MEYLDPAMPTSLSTENTEANRLLSDFHIATFTQSLVKISSI